MRTAIGIALSQAAGFRAMHGTLCTPLMPAQAAHTSLLAQAGFTRPPAPLEVYLSVFSEQPDPDALAGRLGQRFESPR
jgi:hypothetical protein